MEKKSVISVMYRYRTDISWKISGMWHTRALVKFSIKYRRYIMSHPFSGPTRLADPNLIRGALLLITCDVPIWALIPVTINLEL